MTPVLTLGDFYSLAPLLILFIGSLSVLILESFFSKIALKLAKPFSFVILLLALITSFYSEASDNPLIAPWIRFDMLAYIFTKIFLIVGLFIVLLSPNFRGEYYFLILSALSGLILVGSAFDFLTLFLGIEALSISLYILCGFIKSNELSHESAVKYFLTGALATAFLIYGIALVYGATGTTSFAYLLEHFKAISSLQDKALFFCGIGMITIALLFKAAIFPFHQWAPDVYAGAPLSVTTFMAVATKIGAFAALASIFFVALPNFSPYWNEAIAWIAYPTLIYANFVALKQIHLKRFFAYSGIAQAGFLLLPFVSGLDESLSALLFYLVIYALATLGSFAVISALKSEGESISLHDLKGLFKRSPLLALFFSFCLLTLAGIPPTAGFLAKFFVLKGAFESGYTTLVIVGLLTSVLSAYYYLRPILIMITKPDAQDPVIVKQTYSKWVSAAACLLILGFSLFPNSLETLLRY